MKKNNYENTKEKGSIEGFFLASFGWGLVVLVVFLLNKKWLFPQPLASDRIKIDDIYNTILITTATAFVVVKFLWGLFIWKFSSKKVRKASFWHHSMVLELSWTAVTAIIISIVIIKGINIWGQIYSSPPKNAIVVEVVAQQFAWNFRLAGKDGKFGIRKPHLIKSDNPIGIDKTDENAKDDIISQDELYLPINEPVVLKITSIDVIHSFFLPNFRVKQDAVPGMISQVWFTPTKLGKYELMCAELCGLNHYSMRGSVFVVERKKFEQWLEEQQHNGS